eukprot:5546573-Amphidinium_carterae.1
MMWIVQRSVTTHNVNDGMGYCALPLCGALGGVLPKSEAARHAPPLRAPELYAADFSMEGSVPVFAHSVMHE